MAAYFRHEYTLVLYGRVEIMRKKEAEMSEQLCDIGNKEKTKIKEKLSILPKEKLHTLCFFGSNFYVYKSGNDIQVTKIPEYNMVLYDNCDEAAKFISELICQSYEMKFMSDYIGI